MKRKLPGCLLLAIQCTTSLSATGQEVEWIVPQATNVSSSFRGIAVVDDREAWVSGSNGIVIHTVNGGATWPAIPIADSKEFDFRDIAVLPSGDVLLLSAGPGEKSRVFRSADGGVSWTTTLTNRDVAGFFNAFTFLDTNSGVLIGDPIDGHLDVYRTSDGGITWQREQGPQVNEGEYGFAASGTNVAMIAPDDVWVATGGSIARVLRWSAVDRIWASVETPMAQGNESTGIFSIAFRDARHGIIVGGDYKNPDIDNGNVARTTDGGATWTLTSRPEKMPHKACVRNISGKTWMTVGRTGVAMSRDDGVSWNHVSRESWYTFDVHAKTLSGWMAGSDGRVARFTVPKE